MVNHPCDSTLHKGLSPHDVQERNSNDTGEGDDKQGPETLALAGGRQIGLPARVLIGTRCPSLRACNRLRNELDLGDRTEPGSELGARADLER